MSEARVESETGLAAQDECTRQVLVTNQLGLHARPASQIAREAQAFAASITIAGQGQSVDAKSILDILTLSAAMGSTLEIRASGSDAAQAVDRLTELFAAKFGEK